jgi:hypothetical protein
MPGAKNTVAFHVTSINTFLMFYFNFELDVYVLQSFSHVPSLSEEGFVLEEYIYFGAKDAVTHLQNEEGIPSSPISAKRALVAFADAEAHFKYLKTGKRPDIDQ